MTTSPLTPTDSIECTRCHVSKERSEFRKIHETTGRGLCRDCKNAADKQYRAKNKEKVAAYFRELWKDPARRAKNRLMKEYHRFGLDATAFVQGKCCELCSISNDEHIRRFGIRLTIHHKDGQGRMMTKRGLSPNNDPNNFQIVCSACHAKLENPTRSYEGRMEKAWITRKRDLSQEFVK